MNPSREAIKNIPYNSRQKAIKLLEKLKAKEAEEKELERLEAMKSFQDRMRETTYHDISIGSIIENPYQKGQFLKVDKKHLDYCNAWAVNGDRELWKKIYYEEIKVIKI